MKSSPFARLLRAGWWGCALAALCCSACGEKLKLYPVRGKVFVDGKPAEGALVVFHPVAAEGPPTLQPAGKVDKDGAYALRTYFGGDNRLTKDGATCGEYRVSIVWLPPGITNEQILGWTVVPDKLKHRYSNGTTSKLYAQVDRGPTEVPSFELTMKP